MTFTAVATPRLLLRQFMLEDAARLHAILAEPDVLRYFPSTRPPSLERVRAIIENQLRHWEVHGYGWWAVERRTAPGLIGWIGLQSLPDTGETEIAYLLDKACWGLGLATEGGRAGLRFGFEGLGLEQIVGITHPENVASQRVLEKLGLAFAGEAEYFGIDVCRYVISAEMHRQRIVAE